MKGRSEDKDTIAAQFQSRPPMDRLLMNDITHDERARISRMHTNERVIIIAPVEQDAAAMATLLDTQGFETQICNGSAEYSRQMIDSAGALLLTEEALESPQGSRLLDLLKGAAALVRITAHHSHKRRRISPGRITRFSGCGSRICDFAGAAYQHPDADALGASCIAFSPAAISGARSR